FTMGRRFLFTLAALGLFPTMVIGAKAVQGQDRARQLADPDKVPDPVGRFAYIKEYTRAMRAMAKRRDDENVKQLDKFGGMVIFLTEWTDDHIEKRRQLLDTLAAEAKKISAQ